MFRKKNTNQRGRTFRDYQLIFKKFCLSTFDSFFQEPSVAAWILTWIFYFSVQRSDHRKPEPKCPGQKTLLSQ